MQSPEPPPAPPRLQRVLLVEDNDFLREELASWLAAPGRELLTSPSAEDAQQQAAQALAEGRPLALLVTDIGLPGANGITLARQLQQQQPGLPVVLCTGHDGAHLAAAVGANTHHVCKDEADPQLTDLVTRLLATGATDH